MLGFDALNHIAKVVAHGATGLESEDVQQSIWERFLRYPPKSRMYAWQTAYSVRNQMWRDSPERTEDIDFINPEQPHGTNVENGSEKRWIGRMRRKLPTLVNWMILYNLRRRHTNAEKTMASRYRQRLRELKGD